MTALRRLWRFFKQPNSSNRRDPDDALSRAWIRDQLLEARIRLLEREVLDRENDDR